MNGTYTVYPKIQPDTVTMPTKKRVGIFGGTFNPPHIGQLILAESIGKQLGLEKIFWMPNAVPVDGTHASAVEPSYRAQLVKMAIMGNPLFDIELREIRKGGKSYTYQTMRDLVEQHPENEYFFILGGEKVSKLATWDYIDELTRLVTFVAGARGGNRHESDYPIVWLDVPDIAISSSDIRTKLRLNQSINYLVPEREACFIQEYNLYRGIYD
ncbi:nicotinate-nucleotide adenylyltransferase [Leuconostoc citreum]|jgi:nicotinate-nucleotide adenylyltransferase|uniref:Probable nicotinate-nucleotide adenylyltransferase n=1 Tax=Leuconostoc citreum (strain KM20) TaxID=349519 RepID=B1MXH6_LEUCK|nr:nicotinate-nucleotide adenylyltransferase [Leuconostoc citreum]ACA82228.1 Nicotinate (nicotinamide) nucleotide adenylyltransferase [Leuconostoc citreum KM20]MCS8584489.1 nicotinate-nucleotide adenylyltransferase [Leuconostoc citreum]MCS8601809.1 nicotinate-nucleotide adenylyltransferase [Leuconostoc citreum]QGN61230.1 nicotinate-nucleotide adenylyltransferase [Leuconostoc citreum]QQE98512.1 nicotinate-nucleotide adenylyltransferase [Leuconostoc citreum]